MIDPADFEKYLQLQAEAEALKQKMIPHAERVAVALYGSRAKITGFWKYPNAAYAGGLLSEDEGISIPMELLYAQDWEAQVAVHRDEQRILSEKISARYEKQRLQRVKDRDLKELDRLKKEYPDAV